MSNQTTQNAPQLPSLETVTGEALNQGLPPVSEHVVAFHMGQAAAKPAAETASAPKGEPMRDALGKAFDAKVHRTNADGSPFKGKRGQFMPRGGRKPQAAPNAPQNPPDVTGSTVPANIGRASTPALEVVNDVVTDAEHEASAEVHLRAAYAIADTVFQSGGEWQPDDREHEDLRKVFVAWRKASGAKPLPPGLAFATVCASYAFKRFAMAKTWLRLVRWLPWLGEVCGEPIQAEPAKPAAKAEPKPEETKPAAEPAEPAQPEPMRGPLSL